MNNQEILNRSKKILTNRFTGNNEAVENVSGAIMDKFQFNLHNQSKKVIKLALLPAYMNTLGHYLSVSGSGRSSFIFGDLTKVYSNPEYSVDLVKTVDFTENTVITEPTILTKDGVLEVFSIIARQISDNVNNVSMHLHRHNTAALNVAGYPVDAVLDSGLLPIDKSGDLLVSEANPTKQIGDFLDFIKYNPIFLKEMTIISDDQKAFSTDMEIAYLDPFKRNPEKLIDMNTFYSKYQKAKDRIDLKFNNPLLLNNKLLWTINVPAAAKMSIIWRF